MVFYAAKRLKVKIEDDMSNWQLEILATFRFLDKDDYENEIFSKPSCARTRTNVIRHHSTTNFGENVVMAGEQVMKFLKFKHFATRKGLNPLQ